MSQSSVRWENKLLGDVCIVERGSSPRPIKHYLTEAPSGVNWVKIGDTKNVDKFIYKTKQKITKEGAKRSRRVNSGDFILTNSMSYGKPYVMATDGYIHDGWFVLRLPQNIDRDFFYYLLVSRLVQEQFSLLAAGAVVKNISGDLVKKAILPIPPLPEQKRIVTILDEAFAGISQSVTNAEKNLANARELFESYLNNVFTQKGEGWEEKQIGEISSIEYGYTDKSTLEGDFRYVRITDIDKNGNLIKEGQKYIKHSNEAEKFVLNDNDLLMARTGATFAKVLLYKDYEKSVFASYLIRITFTENIENALYWYFTKTRNYWDQANFLSSGAAQPHFNGAALKQVVFSYPKSIEQQKLLITEFKKLSNETQKIETIYKQKLTALNELKQSILQKAFSGELTTEDIPKQVNG